jgi:two-component system, cell cycle sensor histidine kinase and response regulator CckA
MTLAQLHAEMDERQQLAEQLRQAQKMETVGRLAGGVAHDFNNLLTVILGYTTLGIKTSPTLPVLRTYLEDIQSAAQRAADLTQQLLAFSRRQMIDPKVINLNDLILSILPMQRRIISENIDLVTLLAPDLWTTWADPGQMQRVVMNLVVNARDAMPGGGKLTIETMNLSLDKVSIRPSPELNPGDYVLLSISDNGIGMTDEIMAQIFDPFFTTKEVGEGTGLGLSSCYGIVAQIGGCITVDSQVDCGTTFRVYLPRAEEEASTEQLREELTYLPRGHETVLVAEDEPAIRNLISHVLQDQGYQVLQAANGIAALLEATRRTQESIDLLITDMVMPQMGGIELAKQLRAMWPDIRILFISGYTNLLDARDLMALGGEFLQKPLLPSTLAVKVRELLDKTPTSHEIEHDIA